MKQTSEAEYVTHFLDRWTRKTGSDWLAHPALARQLIIALRRRGWKPPTKKVKVKK